MMSLLDDAVKNEKHDSLSQISSEKVYDKILFPDECCINILQKSINRNRSTRFLYGMVPKSRCIKPLERIRSRFISTNINFSIGKNQMTTLIFNANIQHKKIPKYLLYKYIKKEG